MQNPRYFDYAATTPVDPRVAQKMMQCLTLDGNFGNPASRSHKFGWFAEEAVDNARAQIAQLVNADPREIIFTSGATESNNLALKGAALSLRDKGQHIITMQTEHKAVLDVCAFLETQGFDLTFLAPQSDGRLDLQQLQAAMRAETILVSVMHVNNETGVLQDIEAIGQLCNERGVLFHVDAAQSAGKIAIDLGQLAVDLMSFSSHKVYGPKGMGALFVRRKPGLILTPLIHGGGHERGMRSGTLATHQIVGMGEAFEIAQHELANWQIQVANWFNYFTQSLETLPGVELNGHKTLRVNSILNLRFGGIEGETMMMAMQDIAISTGSACTSFSVEPSYVLKAMGLSDEQAHSSLRFSLGRFTSDDDVQYVVEKIKQTVIALQNT